MVLHAHLKRENFDFNVVEGHCYLFLCKYAIVVGMAFAEIEPTIIFHNLVFKAKMVQNRQTISPSKLGCK